MGFCETHVMAAMGRIEIRGRLQEISLARWEPEMTWSFLK